MSEVVWLHTRYPRKEWAIHFLAKKVAKELFYNAMSDFDVRLIPEQFTLGQFTNEINRNLLELQATEKEL